MSDSQEEILLCTSCHHIIASKAYLRGHAYSHPILKVLICKSCYNRVTNVCDSKLCLWCSFPGNYTTCNKCSSNFCMKCLKNNFSAEIFGNIIRKKNWTCFHCLPDLLLEHTEKCAEVLENMENVQPTRHKRSCSNKKSLKKHNGDNSNVSSSEDELPSTEDDRIPSSDDYNFVKGEILECANKMLMLGFEINPKTLKFINKFRTQSPSLKIVQHGYSFTNHLIDAVIKNLKTWKHELKTTENKWKEKFSIPLYNNIAQLSDDTNSDNADNELENISNSPASEPHTPKKKKKYRLSLKRTDEVQLPHDDTFVEFEEESQDQVLEDGDQEILPVYLTVKIETEPPDEDFDRCSIFSDTTVIINQDILPPNDAVVENIIENMEHDVSNDETDCDSLLFETDCITTTEKADVFENVKNLCTNPEKGEDASSEKSFTFDINSYGSRSPSHSECNKSSSDTKDNIDMELNSTSSHINTNEINVDCTTEVTKNKIESPDDLPVIEHQEAKDVNSSDSETDNPDIESNNTGLNVDTNEKDQLECTTELKNKNEIESLNNLPPDQHPETKDVLSSDSEIPNLDVESNNTSLIVDTNKKSQLDCTTEIDLPVNDLQESKDVHSSDSEVDKVDVQLNNAVLNVDANDKSEPGCTIVPKIESPVNENQENKDIHSSDSESPNNDEVTNIVQSDETSNKTMKEVGDSLQLNGIVADKDEVTTTLTGEDEKMDEGKAVDEVSNSLTALCCSYNTKTDEPNVNNAKDLHTSSNIDGHDTTLIKYDISDVVINQAKINFFDELGLVPNRVCITENGTEDKNHNDNTELCQNITDALVSLEEDDSNLFDSDLDTSTSSVSDDEEESVVNTNIPNQRKLGLVNKELPSLPTETIILANESEIITTDDEFDIEISAKDQIKPCWVLVTRLEDVLAEQSTQSTVKSDELREIERLTNFNSLGLKRKADNAPDEGKSKKRKVVTSSSVIATDNDITDMETDADETVHTPTIRSPAMSTISEEGIFDAIINFSESLSDFGMDSSGVESDGEHEEKKKKKKKEKRAASTESNKENQPDNQNNEETTAKELTAEEIEKRKWKNDPLLRAKVRDSESGDETDGTVEGDNIISDKLKLKMEALEKKEEEKANARKLSRRASNSSQSKSENESDNDANHSCDEDVEGSKQSIVINTDTDSDIEFISESRKKKKYKSELTKSGNVLCISSDDDEIKDSDYEDPTNKTKGRKNIRAILSDETLKEETKEATERENQRKERVNQRQSQLDKILKESVNLSQEEGLILDVDPETEKPLVVVHSAITKRLKPHQKNGVRFMWENCYEGVKQLQKDPGSGCILAHCMGLGKTFQVVALIHTLFAHPVTKTKHVLVVCPLSLVLNWKNEFKQGLENVQDNVNINIFCISDRNTNKERRLFLVDKWRQQTGVLIMGYEAYEILTSLKNVQNKRIQENVRKVLVNPGPGLVVLDEGHLLKNGKNLRTKALMKVNTKRRIILTGTPMQNNLTEYYHMVQFIKPNLLGSYAEYTNRFFNPITNGQYHNSTADDCLRMRFRSHVLYQMLKDTVQRYEVTELKPYLPPIHDFALFIQPHIIQAQLYEKYLELIKSESGAVRGSLINNFHKLHVLWTHPCLLHLRQEQKRNQKKKKEMDVINLDPEINDADEFPEGWWHPLCPDDYKTNVEYGPKFKIMLGIIRECEKLGDKILIFSTSLIELDAIEMFLQQQATPTSQWRPKKDYYRMDGTVSPDVRPQLCNEFNDKNNTTTRVFLISNRVGGLGLNLTAANRVILMDVNWNPAYDNQSVFRIYRFHQTKQCYIYRLISMGTMEEVVYQRQINKLAMAGRVVDEMQISRHYNSDDLQKMYRLQYNIELERPTLPVPPDMVLATVIQECEEIFQYHEHQSLLENKPDEELDEESMKLAWDQFHKEKETATIEEQKKRFAATQAVPGPSSVNPFLPRPAGPQVAQQMQNNFYNKMFKGQPQIAKTKVGEGQPNFEVVLVDEHRRDNPITPLRLLQNTVQKHKPNELNAQFHTYLKQLKSSGENDAGTNNPTTSQPSNTNSTSILNVSSEETQNKELPEMVNPFIQPQPPAKTNLGYTIPANVIANLTKPTAGKAPLPRNRKSSNKNNTGNIPNAGKAPLTTNRKTINKNSTGNIPNAGKAPLATNRKQPSNNNTGNTPPGKAPPFAIINRVHSKANYMKHHKSAASTSKTNAVDMQKNVANPQKIRLPKDIKPAEVKATPTVNTTTDIQSGLQTKHKNRASHGVVINNNFNEIIDVDSVDTTIPLQNNGTTENDTTVTGRTEQELINTLHRNLNITLSVRDKPNQNYPESTGNLGENVVSISPIRRNRSQSNCNDVIEID